MKHVFSLLLLAMVTATAYADKNHKASKVRPPKAAPQPAPAAHTAWQGTGKEHYELRQRDYDARVGRNMPIDIDCATAAKYGATRPAMPAKK